MQGEKSTRSQSVLGLKEVSVILLVLVIWTWFIAPYVRMMSQDDGARVAAAKTDISTFDDLLQKYRKDTGKFPTKSDGLRALAVKPWDAVNWKGPYVSSGIPRDPWGNAYVYQSPGPSKRDFLIVSYGSDGKPGGEDEAADITSDDND